MKITQHLHGIILKSINVTAKKIERTIYMAKTLITQITDCIEKTFDIGGKNYSKKVIVFPCGDVGIQVANIMKNIYSIEPAYLIDNKKCRFNPNIRDSSFFKDIDVTEYVIILASTNRDIYLDLRNIVFDFFPENRVLELECMINNSINELLGFKTKIGRYCYGPICRNHELIESIGSFCCFAEGVDVVPNHEMKFITTHPILYSGLCY